MFSPLCLLLHNVRKETLSEDNAMIYLDNAATTFPKPPQVIAAIKNALVEYGGNPGRAGHALSLKTAEAVFCARQKCADFFNAEVDNTIFTLNCTHALNIAIKGVAVPKCHYVMSDIEHNAASRPIHAVTKAYGGSYSIAKTFDDDDETLRSFEAQITTKTNAVVCTAASNVTGKIMPFSRLAKMCREKGVCFILDAAQGGGVIPIRVGDGVNFICCSGHKGLYGPMGTGLLVADGKYKLRTFMEGGTGSNSHSLEQPLDLPDRYESGTVNTPGVIGLGCGIDFVNKIGFERIYSCERKLCELFVQEVSQNKRIKLYFDNFDGRVPLVPFNIVGTESSSAARSLSEKGICVRGGLHCAFMAHKKIGTLETGAMRMAPSVFSGKKEVMALVKKLCS